MKTVHFCSTQLGWSGQKDGHCNQLRAHSHTCLTPGLRRLNSWAQASVFVSCDTTTWSLYHSCFRLARLQKHRGGGKPGGNQMAICDLALEFTHALWFLLYSRLSNSIYWKRVTKDSPYSRGGGIKLSPFGGRMSKNLQIFCEKNHIFQLFILCPAYFFFLTLLT